MDGEDAPPTTQIDLESVLQSACFSLSLSLSLSLSVSLCLSVYCVNRLISPWPTSAPRASACCLLSRTFPEPFLTSAVPLHRSPFPSLIDGEAAVAGVNTLLSSDHTRTRMLLATL